ncbi:MAG: hypothetical protein ACQCN5_01850 [Candidatus Bathyarchaeia archaeon]|jgi:hypothetical protein
MSEQTVVSKVEELMQSLDQVKKYKALSQLMVDFIVIVLASVVAFLALQIVVNFLHLSGAFEGYFEGLTTLTTRSLMSSSQNNLFAILIPGLGVLVGVAWVDYKLKKVEVNTWKSSIQEGFPGALKLLEDIDWNSILQDIQTSKVIYALYSVAKVVGNWILVSISLIIVFGFGLTFIHTSLNIYLLAGLSLILALVLSSKDLQKKYQQVTSLDALLWELRWFNSEFKTAEFQA